MRIVIPTDDKKTIAKFTGRAAYFQIYDLQGEEVSLVRTIENTHHHEHASHDHHHHHGQHSHHGEHSRGGHSHAREVAAMKDADLMICSHMGKHFEQALKAYDIGIFVTKTADIHKAVEEYRSRKA